MNRFDPVLDQPHSIDVESLDPASLLSLANHDVHFQATPQSDLRSLLWPGGGGEYARAITLRLTAFHGDALVPMVTRTFPGYVETIFGSEALIVSKRLAAPLRSEDDRALFWSCECQAEGDMLLRVDVDIDWGEELEQRLVDGLLVAQANPGRRQGIYKQANADSTRVFGNPLARPDSADLDEAGKAHLVYHVLVNGIADVSLLLTLSDVGEQVAWNSFLALRDTERTFDRSNSAWESSVRTARIWTPDPRVNRKVQRGKVATLQGMMNTPVGSMPASRRIADLPALVASMDALDVRLSRNALACVRRVIERSAEADGWGYVPATLPLTRRDGLDAPGASLLDSTWAYLHTLRAHLLRHPSSEAASDHRSALRLCADRLVRERGGSLQSASQAEGRRLASALACAVALEVACAEDADSADAARWQSEIDDLERRLQIADMSSQPSQWQGEWIDPEGDESPWTPRDPWQAVQFAGDAIWVGCGVELMAVGIRVAPAWPDSWWWALTDLPTAHGKLTLVWDGSTLHSTLPLSSAMGITGEQLPVLLHGQIHMRHIDETDFDLTFVFVDEASDAAADSPAPTPFRPQFLTSP